MAKKEKKEKLSRKDKKALKNNGEVSDLEVEESAGSKIGVALVTIIIIAIWLGIFALLIKLDVGGFGSNVLYPVLKNVPVISKILPENKTVADASQDADYPYETLAAAIEQIKTLETQLADAQNQINADNDTISELNTEIERLKAYETKQAEYQKLKAEFDEQIVFNDNAPDISEYQKYYQSIDPTNAELLYKQVIQQTEYSQEVKDYAKAYSEMKPAQAAGIFESMTNNLELVAEILENMSATARGDILGAMKPEVAAKVTKIMAP